MTNQKFKKNRPSPVFFLEYLNTSFRLANFNNFQVHLFDFHDSESERNHSRGMHQWNILVQAFSEVNFSCTLPQKGNNFFLFI